MTGEQLKEHLYKLRISQADISRELGMSSQSMCQALKVADIKTGFLEKICKAFGLHITDFYPEEKPVVQEHEENAHDNVVGASTNAPQDIINNLQVMMAEQSKQLTLMTQLNLALVNKSIKNK